MTTPKHRSLSSLISNLHCLTFLPLLTCTVIHSTGYSLRSLHSELSSLCCLETRAQPSLTLAAIDTSNASNYSDRNSERKQSKYDGVSAVTRTQSSAVPKFLRSRGLFQPVRPYLVRNLIKLCNMHRL